MPKDILQVGPLQWGRLIAIGGNGCRVGKSPDRDGRLGGVGRHPDGCDGVILSIYGVDGPSVGCDHQSGRCLANRDVSQWAVGPHMDRGDCVGVPDVYGPAIGCHHHGERFGAHRYRWKGRVGGRADWGHRVKYAIRNIDGLPVWRDDDRLRSSSDQDRRAGRMVRCIDRRHRTGRDRAGNHISDYSTHPDLQLAGPTPLSRFSGCGYRPWVPRVNIKFNTCDASLARSYAPDELA